jgi:hypothetical protein
VWEVWGLMFWLSLEVFASRDHWSARHHNSNGLSIQVDLLRTLPFRLSVLISSRRRRAGSRMSVPWLRRPVRKALGYLNLDNVGI